jgi:phosphoribosylformimino-5-aminoimidazole carboxamide ribotide isomerase
MIAIPAVDLRGGKCVQLVGGDYDAEKIRLEDPPSVAREWVREGFTRLHVVDLDAATGRGHNMEIIREILRTADVPVQVGGGVRDESRIERLLDEGASWVVVGTRAVEDEDWREGGNIAPECGGLRGGALRASAGRCAGHGSSP